MNEELRSTEEILEAEHKRMQERMESYLANIEPEVMITIEGLGKRIAHWNEHQGFWQSENVGEKIALMHSELSEALEQHRKPHPDEHLPHMDGFTIELADCIIRILDFCGRNHLPLGQCFLAKLKYNLSRPYMHGKKF